MATPHPAVYPLTINGFSQLQPNTSHYPCRLKWIEEEKSTRDQFTTGLVHFTAGAYASEFSSKSALYAQEIMCYKVSPVM